MSSQYLMDGWVHDALVIGLSGLGWLLWLGMHKLKQALSPDLSVSLFRFLLRLFLVLLLVLINPLFKRRTRQLIKGQLLKPLQKLKKVLSRPYARVKYVIINTSCWFVSKGNFGKLPRLAR